MALRFALFEDALSLPLRVLTVFADSPAEHAGLKAQRHFVIGDEEVCFLLLPFLSNPARRRGSRRVAALPVSLRASQGVYRHPAEFVAAAQSRLGESLVIFVFDEESEKTLQLTLRPREDWGGLGWRVASFCVSVSVHCEGGLLGESPIRLLCLSVCVSFPAVWAATWGRDFFTAFPWLLPPLDSRLSQSPSQRR